MPRTGNMCLESAPCLGRSPRRVRQRRGGWGPAGRQAGRQEGTGPKPGLGKIARAAEFGVTREWLIAGIPA